MPSIQPSSPSSDLLVSGDRPAAAAAPRRRVANYLLDSRLQLKYTAMVLAVTLAVAGVLGVVAYHYSRGQTEALSIQIALQPELDPRASRDLRAWSQMQDQQVLWAIIGGIVILGLVLGVTSIVVTHKLVGPVYRIKKLHQDITQGSLQLRARIRKGDELQDFFASFGDMVEALRQRQKARIARLDAILAVSGGMAGDEVTRRALRELRDEMQAELER